MLCWYCNLSLFVLSSNKGHFKSLHKLKGQVGTNKVTGMIVDEGWDLGCRKYRKGFALQEPLFSSYYVGLRVYSLAV